MKWFARPGILFFMTCSFFLTVSGQARPGSTLKISFVNTIDSVPVTLDSITYTNCWKESFTISKLKYYISNIQLQTASGKIASENNSYHLINEEDTFSKSFNLAMLPGAYNSISFLIGVDSFKNVSGAQTGALDPLNAMFWAWHTGYIMFKLEGNSPQSTSVNNKMEYHIGGFSGANNVLRKVELKFAGGPIVINNRNFTEIIIQADIGKIWNGLHVLTITHTPVCATPGEEATRIADNYSKAFEVSKIIHP